MITRRLSNLNGTLLLTITTIGWSLGGLLIKLIHWDSVAIAGWRAVVNLLALLLLGIRPRIRWSKPFILGAISIAAANITFIVAIRLTFVANAVFLQSTAIFHVALLGWLFLGERLSKFDVAMVFLLFSGVGLFFAEKLGIGVLAGNLSALASGLAFGVYTVIVRRHGAEMAYDFLFYGNLLLACLCLPWMFPGVPDPQSISCLLLLGILQQAIATVCYIAAMSTVRAIDAILFTAIATIMNPLIVFLLLGEVPGTLSLAGSAIVFTAVTLQSVKRSGRYSRKAP